MMREGLNRFMGQLDEKFIRVLKNLLFEMCAHLYDQVLLSNPAANVVKLDQTFVGCVSGIDAIQRKGITILIQSKAKRQALNVNKALNAMEIGDKGFAYVVDRECRCYG